MRIRVFERIFDRHPRLLNGLHRIGVVEPTTQTNAVELQVLARYAKRATRALEIGSFQGVSAVVIAEAIDSAGTLYCVDPWPDRDSALNPCRAIFERHTKREGVRDRIQVLLGTSREKADEIPSGLDFVFVDGDHSAAGIAFDWSLVRQKLAPGGIVCLHDVLVPDDEPWRRPDSVDYFEKTIARDPRFTLLDRVYSLAVLRLET